MQDILQVGAVTSTHGLIGEVKVFPTTDDPMRFKKLKSVLLGKPESQAARENTADALRELEVERVKFFKNMVIVKFRGLDRIEDVESFRGCPLYVTRKNAVELEEGEYFIADLIGLKVYTDEPQAAVKGVTESEETNADEFETEPMYFLGELTDVLQTGANDVYAVTLSDGREVLIPAIRQCILAVDIEKGSMLVHLLEGLLE
ncbi:MAG: ribosome maturation factor RimM [Lachnospiraceae bacterium]|nr:ribosome maturation factor RimM [Lachnospiraceae bacterium]